jgi:hypothetical protein
MVSKVIPLDFPKLIKKEKMSQSNDEQEKQDMIFDFGAILTDALIKLGWFADMSPGSDVILKKGNLDFKPFQTITQLVNDELDPSAWMEECKRLGIESISIGP